MSESSAKVWVISLAYVNYDESAVGVIGVFRSYEEAVRTKTALLADRVFFDSLDVDDITKVEENDLKITECEIGYFVENFRTRKFWHQV